MKNSGNDVEPNFFYSFQQQKNLLQNSRIIMDTIKKNIGIFSCIFEHLLVTIISKLSIPEIEKNSENYRK